jgi:hypothetical protein
MTSRDNDEASYDGPPWTCSLCTYYNPHSLYLTCGACGEERERMQRRGSAFSIAEYKTLSDSFRVDIEKQGEIEDREKMKRRGSAFSTEEFGSLSDSFRADVLKQEEILERRGSLMSRKDFEAMSDSIRQDLDHQEEQISRLGNSGRPFSIDEIGFLSESLRLDADGNPSPKNEFLSDDFLSDSLRRDMVWQNESTKNYSNGGINFLSDSFREKNDLREQLLLDEAEHLQERENQQRMADMLRIRRLEIERLEGIAVTEIGERATMPGVCKVSPAAMDWRAQQHMVKQWDEKLTAKEEELQAMRASLNML